MGMCLGLCTLGDANIRKVLADPPLVWKVIAPDDPEAYETARGPSGGFLAKLFGSKKRAPDDALVLAGGEVMDSDLDKAWHGIHYLLTQTDWEGAEPLDFLVRGGEEVRGIEVGYGPARVLTAAQVQRVHDALASIDVEFLRRRFAPEQMMKLKIYPEIWDRDAQEDDTFGYCAEYFAVLKAFVGSAAEKNLGLVLYLT